MLGDLVEGQLEGLGDGQVGRHTPVAPRLDVHVQLPQDAPAVVSRLDLAVGFDADGDARGVSGPRCRDSQ